MKRQFLFAAGILVTGSIILVSSCSKDDGDTTAPVITMAGASSVESVLNETYVDAGAAATDDEDGTINVSVDNPVNKDLTGTYTVTYTATDNAGNTSTATRSVRVYNEAEGLAGNYAMTENGVTHWNQQVTPSESHNNRIVFSYFANYANNNTIYAEVNGIGNPVELPPTQTTGGIGSSGCSHRFTPNGTGNSLTEVLGKYTFSIKFFDETLAGGSGCNASAPVDYEDLFIQQ